MTWPDPSSRAGDLDLANALAKLEPDDRALLALRYVAGLNSTSSAARRASPHPAPERASSDSSSASGRSSAMTDLERFEAGFERRLRAFADVPVAPVDAEEIAGRSSSRAGSRRTSGSRCLPRHCSSRSSSRRSCWLVDRRSRQRSSWCPPRWPAGSLEQQLAGTWIADVPADLTFRGEGSAQRMGLVIDPDSNQYSFLQVGGSDLERFAATTEWPDADSVRFVTRGPRRTSRSRLAVPGCAARDAGTYRSQRSTDGLRLTLTAIDDACAARSVVMARTWTRSMAARSRGGFGVVDAFDPLFTVELPDGIYTASRSTDWQLIHDQVHGDEFIAVKDPQGFLDPCDISRGRYEVAPGAQAWVDYFAQLHGFTTDSVTDLLVDGHAAKLLVVHIDAAESCPSGPHLSEWQPKNDTSDQHSFLRPETRTTWSSSS
jgi:hypothetical protein